MKRIIGTFLLVIMIIPAVAAAPKPVTIENSDPVAVTIRPHPDTEFINLEGHCSAPCYRTWAEIDWKNETTDKVLVLTDLIFSNEGTGDKRLRASVTVWDQPCDYTNDASVSRVSAMHVFIPPNDTRSLHLQTGLRVYPTQCLAIPLFEGAGNGFVSALGRLEDK